MKKGLTIIIAICLVTGLSLVGCGAEKADSSQDAIQTAKTMATVQEQTDYLVKQAKDFYSSDDFQGAIDIAQYVLRYLDKDSKAAQEILQKAKDQLTAQVKKQAEDLKKSFSFGK